MVLAFRLTYDTDLPDFNEGTLDVLDARQTFVQVRLDDFTGQRVAFGDGSKDPAKPKQVKFLEFVLGVADSTEQNWE